MALSHHERRDRGRISVWLDGRKHPFNARFLALTDISEDLGLLFIRSIREAYKEIEKARRTRFHPELTDRFLGWMKQHEFSVETNANLLYEEIAAI